MKTIHSDRCPICGCEELTPVLKCKDHFATKEVFTICECKICKFRLTQDFPSENEIGKYYDVPEYVSHSDTNKGIINSLYHIARKIAIRSKAKIVKEYSNPEKGMLLDVGAGTGYFLNKMKEEHWVVTGIEKAESARKHANSKFGLHLQESEYLYEIKPKSKDVITMWHVLEHLEHLDKVMSHCHSILKDDGTFIIAVPNKDSFDAQSYQAEWAAYDVPRHLWHFSPDCFERLANKHDFELVAIKPMYFDAFYISMLSEKNRGTFAASLVGLLKGEIFFLQTLNNKSRSSSVIYILKKKQVNN